MNRWARTLADAWRRKAEERVFHACMPRPDEADLEALCRRSEAFAEDLGEHLAAPPQVLRRNFRPLLRSLR